MKEDMEDVVGMNDPELKAARIARIKAETRLFDIQADKEAYISTQHRLAAEEAERINREMIATNDQNRVLDFLGNTSTANVENAISKLSRWRRQSKDPITIRISSPGGNVIDGLALYDYILGLRQEGIEVTTCVLGMAASMAGVLLQAGSEGCRVVGPNAHVMIHEVGGGAAGKISEVEDETKFLKRLNERLWEILSRRSQMTVKQIAVRAARRDWWLTAEDCVTQGFADRIGVV